MYIAGEISSDHVDKILRKWGSMYPWIDDDTVSTFFELMVERPEFMDKVAIIASKIYYQGLILISIYHEKSIYFIVQPGEGDQPLLDVKFPDVSRHGQGVQIASYHHSSIPFWKRLTLWHIIEGEKIVIPREIPKIRTLSVSSKDYVQTCKHVVIVIVHECDVVSIYCHNRLYNEEHSGRSSDGGSS